MSKTVNTSSALRVADAGECGVLEQSKEITKHFPIPLCLGWSKRNPQGADGSCTT